MKKERYPMCEDQPAQIDCRKSDCIWHKEASCTNVSPAITLNPNKNFVCWSEDREPTKEQLLEKAKRDYPEGTKFKVVHMPEEERVVMSHEYNRLTFNYVDDNVYLNFICGDTDEEENMAAVYKNGNWAKIIAKPIFKLNNKFMYEGDEYWPVYTGNNFWMEKRYVCSDSDFFLYHAKDVKLFATKQEALNYVLEEAKEMFKGCKKVLFKDKEEYEINIESIKIDYWNEPKYNGNVVHVNTLKGSGVIGLNLWQEKLGWIAEPVKEPSLMLGDEVVDILPTGKGNGYYINSSDETILWCKGESVTKEEWIKFYHSLKESWEWVKEATLQLGNYEVFFSRADDSLHFGCVDGIENVTIEQIESITKALNEL